VKGNETIRSNKKGEMMKEPESNQTRRFLHPMFRWIRSVAFLCGLAMAGCVSPLQTPNSLQVPAGQKVLLHAYAKGVQIYRCERSSTDPDQFVWNLKCPEAWLFTDGGTVIGSHYAGPTWEHEIDGSKVVCTVLAQNAAPDTNAIPWLLLRAKSSEGSGKFCCVKYIQRVNTTGGLPPVGGADLAHLGQEVRVRYTAEYYFYRSTAVSAPVQIHKAVLSKRKSATF
jgi:hypothetical protein